jgi:hypothetical protein
VPAPQRFPSFRRTARPRHCRSVNSFPHEYAAELGKNCRVEAFSEGRRSESMRWEDLEQSSNIEDRRGEQGGG